jgi:hypothetical protein
MERKADGHVDNIDLAHDEEIRKLALRTGHEAISQILFSIGLTVHSAQRAAVDNPERVPGLLELIRQQSAAALEQVLLLRSTL